MSTGDYVYNGGWIPDGGHVPIASGIPTLAQAAPGLLAMATDKPAYLYHAWTDLFATHPKYPPQEIGDCTSQGHAHANDLLECVELCLGTNPKLRDISQLGATCTEFLYGAAREIANMLGSGDGCYGAAVARAMTEVGTISRAMLGDEGHYSGQRAKAWGRTGPPAELKSLAARYKIGSVAKVGTYEEGVAALQSGHPITICSDQGFTTERDQDGFCRPKGTWNHCMFVAGVRFDKPGMLICQSWGPDSPSGPVVLNQPGFSFWADQPIMSRIFGQGDSWALSGAPDFGLKSRHLPRAWKLS